MYGEDVIGDTHRQTSAICDRAVTSAFTLDICYLEDSDSQDVPRPPVKRSDCNF